MQQAVDLVADIGEGFGQYRMSDDEGLLNLISSANVACGFHAGDPRIMDHTVHRCKERGVGIGAHPSFPDLVGFGRRTIDATSEEVETDVIYQIGALAGFAAANGTVLQHVAPPGRLGNLVVTSVRYAQAIVRAVQRIDERLIIVSYPGALIDMAREAGLTYGVIGLADRAYRSDGTLVPRSEPGAVLDNEDMIEGRVLRMVVDGLVTSVDGVDLPMRCDSILLHGDNEKAVLFAKRVRDRLVAAGLRIASLAEVVAARGAAASA
jgi:UPF0271 protein